MLCTTNNKCRQKPLELQEKMPIILQQNLELMKQLAKDEDIIKNMEHLIQTSKYGNTEEKI